MFGRKQFSNRANTPIKNFLQLEVKMYKLTFYKLFSLGNCFVGSSFHLYYN